MRKLKLITEAESASYDLEFVYEQTNRDSEKRLYVQGSYLLTGERNKNNRIYEEEDLAPAVESFTENFINRQRAGGTLNHEASPEIDLSKICHRILSLKKEGKLYIGKSLVASTPSGRIMESLINDGFSLGMSSRAVGNVEESAGVSRVRNLTLCSIDCVYDPSIGGSLNNPDTGFVKGILENKEFIIADDGHVAEAFAKFEKHLSKYPTHHRDAINKHILEGIQRLVKMI